MDIIDKKAEDEFLCIVKIVVDQEKLNQFKNATFRVLEINKYDY